MGGGAGDLAGTAAEVLGTSVYDIRPSMQALLSGPAVISVLGDARRADATADALSAAGLPASVVAVKGTRPRFEVRRFAFGDDALVVEDRVGRSRSVEYASIDFLARATVVSTKPAGDLAEKRAMGIGRMLATGLLEARFMRTMNVARPTDVDDMVFAYSGLETPLRLGEKGLLYQGLGEQLAPSRAANFAFVVGELRRRCIHAQYDDRLRQRTVQAQMLGHTLAPDEHVEFAVSLVARCVRGSRPVSAFR